MDRADQLISSILTCCKLRDDWVSSGVQRITNAFAEGMDDLVVLWEDGDIPADVRPLFDFYPMLKEEWRQFGDYVSEKRSAPRQLFWNQLRNMEQLLLMKENHWEPPILETVSELVEQKVSWRQICYIYSHKGEGPFMRNKEPVTGLPMLQYKYEKAVREAKDEKELDRILKRDGGKKVLPDGFVHPFVSERLKAGKRIEARLLERTRELLGRFNRDESGGDNYSIMGVGLPTNPDDGLPPKRGDLDGLTQQEALAAQPPEFVEESVAEDSVEAQVRRSEEAGLAQQAFMLFDKNPNVSAKSIGDTLGVSSKKVNEWLRNRQKIMQQVETNANV